MGHSWPATYTHQDYLNWVCSLLTGRAWTCQLYVDCWHTELLLYDNWVTGGIWHWEGQIGGLLSSGWNKTWSRQTVHKMFWNGSTLLRKWSHVPWHWRSGGPTAASQVSVRSSIMSNSPRWPSWMTNPPRTSFNTLTVSKISSCMIQYATSQKSGSGWDTVCILSNPVSILRHTRRWPSICAISCKCSKYVVK